MKEFIALDMNAPATLESVVVAVTRLSTLDEAEILELVSKGRLSEMFPYRPATGDCMTADFVLESEIVEASPLPLGREMHAKIIQSSMPTSSAHSTQYTDKTLGRILSSIRDRFGHSSN